MDPRYEEQFNSLTQIISNLEQKIPFDCDTATAMLEFSIIQLNDKTKWLKEQIEKRKKPEQKQEQKQENHEILDISQDDVIISPVNARPKKRFIAVETTEIRPQKKTTSVKTEPKKTEYILDEELFEKYLAQTYRITGNMDDKMLLKEFKQHLATDLNKRFGYKILNAAPAGTTKRSDPVCLVQDSVNYLKDTYSGKVVQKTQYLHGLRFKSS